MTDRRASPVYPDVRTRHHTIKASLVALWEQYLYGDGWRLVEIVIGTWVVVRGLTIIFAEGMDAVYYATFPMSDHPLLWGLVAVAIGAARIAGTVINGKWQRSPRLRWSAGVCGIAYQTLHCLIFAQMGLKLLALGYFFWVVLESAGVVRSSIDILRKRETPCRNG
ncbi:hypothetical protein Sa4125_24870 [Aureimonas sp. SA4125]|nr:hypothetical protein Sa4125_24870 [Aureimonas sp. SA4125]